MAKRTYLRDGRAPVPTDERTSAHMSRIRSKNTAPERAMRALLSAAGVRGYRLNHARTPGRPDITFVARKVAVFVHGCFWHGCTLCTPRTPKSNSAWWKKKIGANRERDRRKSALLRKLGWQVVTVRECSLRKGPEAQRDRVIRALDPSSRTSAGRSVARTPRRSGTARTPRRR